VAHGQEDPSATDPIEFVYHPAISEVAFPAQPPGGEKMESYRIDRFGSVNGIVLRSSEDPRPGLKEVLIRVRASSLNYRDLMVLKGGGRGPTRIGVVPLSDGAGEVAAIGEGVTRVRIGDRIAGCFHPRWFGGPIKPDYLIDRLGANLDGMLAEYAVFSCFCQATCPSRKPPPCPAPQ
jgi:threonine dehydrogenase-like Zn-dependent dehydrogenase